jgi:putative transposase
MTVANKLIDSPLAGFKKPEGRIAENGLLKLLNHKLVERALQAVMVEHLGHAKDDTVAIPAGNTLNGKSEKLNKGDFGELPIEFPVTDTAVSSRRSSPSTKPARQALI